MRRATVTFGALFALLLFAGVSSCASGPWRDDPDRVGGPPRGARAEQLSLPDPGGPGRLANAGRPTEPEPRAARDPVAAVAAVESVGMVVEDMDRSVAFFRDVLTFEQVSDVEVTGDEYERLEGVFGLRLRVVRLRLGDEFLDLREFVAPEGRPVPADSRSNDRWFQHVAIIVR